MSASINCPKGHGNPRAQKFCGKCGVSLAGVCAKGHRNPEGQKYCGQCGATLLGSAQTTSSTGWATPATEPPSRDQNIGADGTTPSGDPQLQGQIEADARISNGIGSTRAIPDALSGGLKGLKAFWVKLPKWGKIVAIGLPTLAVAWIVVSGNLGHSDSWKWGYKQARNADTYVSGGMSPELACRGEAKLALMFVDSRSLRNPTGAPTDVEEAVKGCLAGLKDMGR